MIIKKNTEMLLFRFNNFKRFSFLQEHMSVLKDSGYVWMLKLGRQSNMDKIKGIKDCGGWMILRAPKAEGGSSFLAKFSEVEDKTPADGIYPAYYHDILGGNAEDFYYSDTSKQWFRIEKIRPITDKETATLVISKTGKKVDDVIKTTRTAVMFVKNEAPIEIREVEN